MLTLGLLQFYGWICQYTYGILKFYVKICEFVVITWMLCYQHMMEKIKYLLLSTNLNEFQSLRNIDLYLCYDFHHKRESDKVIDQSKTYFILYWWYVDLLSFFEGKFFKFDFHIIILITLIPNLINVVQNHP